MVLRVACETALAVAPVRLLPVAPFKLRAPATAAASAASWHWARATASMPRSTERAMNPQRPTSATAVSGRIAPRDRLAGRGRRVFMRLSLGKKRWALDRLINTRCRPAPDGNRGLEVKNETSRKASHDKAPI